MAEPRLWQYINPPLEGGSNLDARASAADKFGEGFRRAAQPLPEKFSQARIFRPSLKGRAGKIPSDRNLCLQFKMRGFLIALILASFAAPVCAEQPPNLSCKIGPVEKTYGGTKWNVYGCDDKKSLVVVTASGNSAMPFYFFFSPNGDGYDLHGEGDGDKKYTDAAYKDLSALTDGDITALVIEVNRPSNPH